VGGKKKPLIVINYKTYLEGTGNNAVHLSKVIEEMAKDYLFDVIVIPQPTDVYRIVKETSLTVYGQHADNVKPVRNTGKITLEALKGAGAKGILINHSEDQVDLETIDNLVMKAKLLRMKTIVCAQDAEQVKAVANFAPDYVAFEPPELIECNKSIASISPKIIGDLVKSLNYIAPGVKLLIGAGIKTREDLEIVMEQGAEGVLVASGIVKAKNPEVVLMEWMQGW